MMLTRDVHLELFPNRRRREETLFGLSGMPRRVRRHIISIIVSQAAGIQYTIAFGEQAQDRSWIADVRPWQGSATATQSWPFDRGSGSRHDAGGMLIKVHQREQFA